jgi:hypothetical protein
MAKFSGSITIVVSPVILSRYTADPPDDPEEARPIPGGPLYPLDEVLGILAADGPPIELATRKCRRDVTNLFEADLERVVALFASGPRFDGSSWCNNGSGALLACDAYVTPELEETLATGKTCRVRYYLKFAIASSGSVLLVVSCHVSS